MSKHPTSGLIFKVIEELAPKIRAYDWDNVGLQIGSTNQKVKKIMVTLDVLESVVDEAIEQEVNVIIAHHPLLFKPLKRINFDTPEGRIIAKLIRHDITVYAAHTNLDVVDNGVNDMLAERLELQNTKPLLPIANEKLYKFAIYVPESHRDELKKVIGDAGGGEQGDYTHYSFEMEGIESFKPVEGADPYIGEVGEIARVDEVKIESLVSESKLQQVVAAAHKAHPYEEPAYDIIELGNSGKTFGLGRIGKSSETLTLDHYVQVVKAKLGLTDVRVVGDLSKKINTIAVLGGSGEKYIHQVKLAGADAYITGDVGFHQAQLAIQMGLAVIDAGHYIEEIMKDNIQSYLVKRLKDYDVDIITSKLSTDPFKYL